MAWNGGIRFKQKRGKHKGFDGSLRSRRRKGSKRFDGSLNSKRSKRSRGWDGSLRSKGDKPTRAKRIKGYGFDRIIKRAMDHSAQLVHEDEQMLERQEDMINYRDDLVRDHNMDPIDADDLMDRYYRLEDARDNRLRLLRGGANRISSLIENFLDRLHR